MPNQLNIEAIDKLRDIMCDRNLPPKVRISAASVLANAGLAEMVKAQLARRLK